MVAYLVRNTVTENGSVARGVCEEKDGFYVVYVNVETGEVEDYEFNSGLAGKG